MQLIIIDNKKHEFASIEIIACVIVYNIFIDLNDNWNKKKR